MLAFDIMGEVGYGQDFGGIVTGKEHPASKAIHDHMSIIGIVGEYSIPIYTGADCKKRYERESVTVLTSFRYGAVAVVHPSVHTGS